MADNPQTSTESIAVVGLGKIGLTLAAVFANNGFHVRGADINEAVVSSINQGISHITNEPGLEKLVAQAHQNNMLSATKQTSEAVKQSNIIIVIVPVLVDDENHTDYQFIDQAVLEIAKGLKKGSLIIFETTLSPGDTRNRFGTKIEEVSGLKMGKDFSLAYSPERVYSNRIIQDLESYPKVVGGLDEKSLALAKQFYTKALGCELIAVSTLETAEFSKVAECVYRDVNIALANELAMFADEKNVDMSEVITASNSQPFSHIHHPGIGVGGHCIPIYPYFFINKGLTSGLTPLARTINDQMADYSLMKMERVLGSFRNKNILILGLSYRENVKEPTKSTTLLLIEKLKEEKANIFVHDPQFTANEIEQYAVRPLQLEDALVEEMDAVIIQAFHKEYENLDFKAFTNCKLVMDGRNKIKKDKITTLNMTHIGIGNGRRDSNEGRNNGSNSNG
ncbi:nucleotide sugar dehydrogenase [Oceanobacillus alkalisoli]|uniref:nucleotide sugar dehydrogenase n=1 Tax=Oceanobacillus alkalisoli TaxID=2925113 RepID=UPI001EF0C7B7|nr:nucleotide sugar dehydrogenase [Oceanobacillus alkalisoli]MCF3943108.1 nucleotide sugar dehydrogenase [Oceanobacillus alkalisoli]MCG5104692.1 nucleotide sugar dehydrogenase [Oceanobacillus alkalisoli]